MYVFAHEEFSGMHAFMDSFRAFRLLLTIQTAYILSDFMIIQCLHQITILEALFLGLVQGFTEWLPISSSGHLVDLPGTPECFCPVRI